MLWLALLLVLAFPASAGASSASVEPFVESPNIDPFGSCSRYAQCPADMLVLNAAAGESNDLTIAQEIAPGLRRWRFLVRDAGATVHAGPGCEQVDPVTVACTAGTVGPLRLGDGDDRLTSPRGEAFGGDGADVISVESGPPMLGEGGDDVLTGTAGEGGAGDDLLNVTAGLGNAGTDVLRCFPQNNWCRLRGGPGDDRISGGAGLDHLFGGSGDDLLRGGGEFDGLNGGRGADRLVGGAGGDHLGGGRGADWLVSREDRSAGQEPTLDRVDCGIGRRDRAVADRRDDVERCERVRLPPS